MLHCETCTGSNQLPANVMKLYFACKYLTLPLHLVPVTAPFLITRHLHGLSMANIHTNRGNLDLMSSNGQKTCTIPLRNQHMQGFLKSTASYWGRVTIAFLPFLNNSRFPHPSNMDSLTDMLLYYYSLKGRMLFPQN